MPYGAKPKTAQPGGANARSVGRTALMGGPAAVVSSFMPSRCLIKFILESTSQRSCSPHEEIQVRL